jgi:hypothetical protein
MAMEFYILIKGACINELRAGERAEVAREVLYLVKQQANTYGFIGLELHILIIRSLYKRLRAGGIGKRCASLGKAGVLRLALESIALVAGS